MLKKVFSGILAGLLISIGGAVFLSCTDKVVGSVAFTIGLLAVCYYGANLYTGRIGYLFDKHDKEGITDLIFGLIGYFFAKVEIPTTPMILGFILGPMFEENLRRASKLAQSDPITNHPISIVFLVITVVAVALSVRSNMKQKKKAELKE